MTVMNLTPAGDLSEAEARERLARDYERRANSFELASYGNHEKSRYYEEHARQFREMAAAVRKGIPQ